MAFKFDEATYRVEITRQGFECASTGTSEFVLDFKILGCLDDQGQQHPCTPGMRSYRQSLANSVGLTLLKGDLKEVGVDLSDLSRLDVDSPDHISLVGKTINMVCQHQQLNDIQVERWRIRCRKKMPFDEVLRLQEKFSKVLQGGAQQPAEALVEALT